MSHTPGPWRSESVFGSRDGAYAIRAKGEGVAVVTGRSITIPRTDETVEANARLIAAAPELLEALKEDVKLMDECAQDSSIQPAPKYVASLEALIAKVEGR